LRRRTLHLSSLVERLSQTDSMRYGKRNIENHNREFGYPDYGVHVIRDRLSLDHPFHYPAEFQGRKWGFSPIFCRVWAKHRFPCSDAVLPGSGTLFAASDGVLPTSDTVFPSSDAAFPAIDALLPGSDVLLACSDALLPSSEALLPSSDTPFPSSDTLLPATKRPYRSKKRGYPMKKTAHRIKKTLFGRENFPPRCSIEKSRSRI